MLLEKVSIRHRLNTRWLAEGVQYGTQTMNARPFAAGVQAVAGHPEESRAWQRAVEGGHHRLWARAHHSRAHAHCLVRQAAL